MRGSLELGASSDQRGGFIVVRGRMRWEIILGTTGTKISAFVNDFEAAADGVLQWLRGADPAGVLSCLQNHLARMSGTARMFELDAVRETRSCQ